MATVPKDQKQTKEQAQKDQKVRVLSMDVSFKESSTNKEGMSHIESEASVSSKV